MTCAKRRRVAAATSCWSNDTDPSYGTPWLVLLTVSRFPSLLPVWSQHKPAGVDPALIAHLPERRRPRLHLLRHQVQARTPALQPAPFVRYWTQGGDHHILKVVLDITLLGPPHISLDGQPLVLRPRNSAACQGYPLLPGCKWPLRVARAVGGPAVVGLAGQEGARVFARRAFPAQRPAAGISGRSRRPAFAQPAALPY